MHILLGDVPVSNSSGSNSVSVIIGGVMGGVILLLMITVVFFIVLLFVERSHRREPSHVYEQVFYNRTKLSTDVKIKHDAAYNATEDVTVDSLYSTFNEVPYTTDSSYAVPAMACSKTSEDEHYDTVQANERSDVEETVVKMDTNPSYGVSTGEDRATATDYDTKAHQSSQEYDYDDVHDDPAQLYYNMATTTTADVEEDIVQHKCTLDQRHDTKTTLVANSAKLTDEDKYGDINQPRCDDNSFDTTVDHNATTKSCLPLIMSGAKPAGEGKYGVINQPRCDDNSFDSTVDHNATTKSCIMSGAKPAGEGKYGVINQPRCDDFSFNTTVDQSLTAKSSPLPYLPLPANDTRSIDKDEYGVINQPQCDDLI